MLVTGSGIGETIFGGSAGRVLGWLEYQPAGAALQQSMQVWNNAGASQGASVTATWIFSVPSAGAQTFTFKMRGSPLLRNLIIDAVYLPFGADGSQPAIAGSPAMGKILAQRDGTTLSK